MNEAFSVALGVATVVVLVEFVIKVNFVVVLVDFIVVVEGFALEELYVCKGF